MYCTNTDLDFVSRIFVRSYVRGGLRGACGVGAVRLAALQYRAAPYSLLTVCCVSVCLTADSCETQLLCVQLISLCKF